MQCFLFTTSFFPPSHYFSIFPNSHRAFDIIAFTRKKSSSDLSVTFLSPDMFIYFIFFLRPPLFWNVLWKSGFEWTAFQRDFHVVTWSNTTELDPPSLFVCGAFCERFSPSLSDCLCQLVHTEQLFHTQLFCAAHKPYKGFSSGLCDGHFP